MIFHTSQAPEFFFFLTFPSMQPNTVKQANFHKNVFQQKTSNAKANRVEREKKKQGKW